MPLAPPRLLLVDTFGLIFRAYYGRSRAQTTSLQTSDGMPTEAIYVFNNMLKRLIEDHEPDYLAAVWEGHGPTFREKIYPDYKANRDAMPEDLAIQLPLIRQLLECWNVAVLSEDGYEADDTIGLLTSQAANSDVDVWVVSSDKDLMQLVRGGVSMFNPVKGELYDPTAVKRYMGVEPERVTDFLALKGDAVDNIPGAPGIGDKGACQLIAEYGDIEQIIEHAEEVKRKAYRESLQNHADQIRLSKRLATLDLSGELQLDLESLRLDSADSERLLELYRKLEFNTMASQMEADAASAAAEAAIQEFESPEEFARWLDETTGPIAIAVVDAEIEPVEGSPGIDIGLFADGEGSRLLPARLAGHVESLLVDESRDIWVHDWKSAIHAFGEMGLAFPRAADDTMLLAFLADSSRTTYSLEKTVERRLATAWKSNAALAAVHTRTLRERLKPELGDGQLKDLYESVELPLEPVLARMESAGVLLAPAILADLSSHLQEKVEALSAEIHDAAGIDFKIGSPKQLGEVLFERLGLPAPKKRGKSKSLSTASDVLEGLVDKHPIAAKVLDWRQFTKLKNTYVDVLPTLVRDDGRLHTTFSPTGSATGRLSSLNPNLQNIPARTEIGREIRKAFVAAEGTTLVAADYSQIELRILAHMSSDPKLLEAFGKGEDIHTLTAAEVLGIAPDFVGPEERFRAKAVNFGIIYGLSAFGLSKQLGISQRNASDYINLYFQRYSTVKQFIADTIEQVKQTGYSETLLGRRRPIADLGSSNHTARRFAERIAVNSPIQGTAADLIKKAMVAVDASLRQSGSKARMLLQVHDELVLEVPSSEVSAVSALVKDEMESAGALRVPLVADIKAGPNWRDMSPIG